MADLFTQISQAKKFFLFYIFFKFEKILRINFLTKQSSKQTTKRYGKKMPNTLHIINNNNKTREKWKISSKKKKKKKIPKKKTFRKTKKKKKHSNKKRSKHDVAAFFDFRLFFLNFFF